MALNKPQLKLKEIRAIRSEIIDATHGRTDGRTYVRYIGATLGLCNFFCKTLCNYQMCSLE